MADEFDAEAARGYTENLMKEEIRLDFILNKIKKNIEEDPIKRRLDIDKAYMSKELVKQLESLGYLVRTGYHLYTISW